MNINNKEELQKLFNFTFYISGECPNEILGCDIDCNTNKANKTVENCVMCWRKALSERINMLKEGVIIENIKIICTNCNKKADVMYCRRIKKKEVLITYICPYCGNEDEEIHYLYE
ncbi:hypothetical protein [Clostridium botulinum]|uniref:hypothetical protein n=1 Tax=Clostridium botulinum TaxID=1491 RepID=UPI001C9B7EF1|nr:hypothetical protein [Clostridium botulinum]MBY6842673.1 hypothetical protein [Clostridium botulinum]